MYDFGLKLRELRKKQKITQLQLAQKLCVSESLISRYENNLAQPPFETLRSIAAVFNVPMDELCGMADARNIVSLSSLSQNQKKIIKKLIFSFKNLNSCTQNISVSDQYCLLGNITAELLKNSCNMN